MLGKKKTLISFVVTEQLVSVLFPHMQKAGFLMTRLIYVYFCLLDHHQTPITFGLAFNKIISNSYYIQYMAW